MYIYAASTAGNGPYFYMPFSASKVNGKNGKSKRSSLMLLFFMGKMYHLVIRFLFILTLQCKPNYYTSNRPPDTQLS